MLAASGGMRYGLCDEVATTRTRKLGRGSDRQPISDPLTDRHEVGPGQLTRMEWRIRPWASDGLRAIIDTFAYVCK